MQAAISVQSLGKRFRCYSQHRPRTIMAAMLAGWRGVKPTDYFWALRDVSFGVAPGEMLGVIGRNGAGKSTLLRLLGRVGRPDEGRILLNGRVGALLDLGAGFNTDLTGRENVYVNAVVAGLLQCEVKRQFDAIVDFAEVTQFIDNPVRTYSTGMMMRLAFSVAVHTHPEILLVDEHLSVGDQAFQNKCLDRISQMKTQGCAVVLISHNTQQIEDLCDRAIFLNQGRIHAEGSAADIVKQYVAAMEPYPEPARQFEPQDVI
jgi:lipopolysaccharide transport system ATP-binding protein